MQRAML